MPAHHPRLWTRSRVAVLAIATAMLVGGAGAPTTRPAAPAENQAALNAPAAPVAPDGGQPVAGEPVAAPPAPDGGAASPAAGDDGHALPAAAKAPRAGERPAGQPDVPVTRGEIKPVGSVVQGTLQLYYSEGRSTSATSQAWIKTAAGSVQVDPADVQQLSSGVVVRAVLAGARTIVTGEVVNAVTKVDVVSSPRLGNATSTHLVTVVTATIPGYGPDSVSAAQLSSLVNNTINQYYLEQTGNQISFLVTATKDWINLSKGCTNPDELLMEAASKAGFTDGPNRHLVIYLPKASYKGDDDPTGCSLGLGTVGNNPGSGGLLYVTSDGADVIAHELGHNLSLLHSNALLCTNRQDATFDGGVWPAGCTRYEYGDLYDLMGPSIGHLRPLGARHLELLGIGGAQRTEVRGVARLVVNPLGQMNGRRALKVIDANGAAYYVEYHAALGRESFLPSTVLSPGVTIRKDDPADPDAQLMLDPTPTGDPSDWASVLEPGNVFTTASGVVRIRVLSMNNAGAEIEVGYYGSWPAKAIAPPAVPAGAAPPPATGGKPAFPVPLTTPATSSGTGGKQAPKVKVS